MPSRKRLLLALVGLILFGSVGVVSAQNTPNKQTPLFVAALGQTKKTWSIVMLDPAADGPEYLTDDQFDEIGPLVSADGRYVVFLRGDFKTNDPLEYYILDRSCARKCQPKPLPDKVNELRDLVWSPVGPQLVAWGLDNAVWLIDVEENTVEQVIAGSWYAYPSWSPDGSTIVVTSDMVPPDAMLSDDIQLIPAEVGVDDSKRINLTYSGLFVEDIHPQYSPDGAWIAYTTRNISDDTKDAFQDNPFALLLLDTNCIKKPTTCPDTRRLVSKDGHMVSAFAWSPDGQTIAYMDGDPLIPDDRYGNLWTVDVQSGKTHQLTDGKTTGSFSWSPDSAAVVYERITDSSYDVYLAFVNGKRDPGPVLTGFRASATPYWAHP
jgi:Tol biopolymer transport system component